MKTTFCFMPLPATAGSGGSATDWSSVFHPRHHMNIPVGLRRSLESELPDCFRPVTPASMELIWPLLQHETGRTTDFSYGGLLMWVEYFKYEYAIVNETLFIKGVVENDVGTTAFSLPVGKMPLAESVAMIRRWCDRHGIRAELSAVPEYAMEALRALNPKWEEELTDWGDYLYEAEPLATLSGKKMAKKRNHVNRFESLYPDWTFEPMDSSNACEAMAFMDIFDLEGDDTPMAVEERRLSRRMIEYVAGGDRRMTGALLKAGGEVCAFTIGDVKGDTLYVHVEKATRRVEGSYEAVNKAFAAYIMAMYPGVRYINREDDSGDEGLRRAKESYHPVEKLRKYNVVF